MTEDLMVSPTLTIPAEELSWTAVRSSGPGGQNVNKLATKVVLRFDLPGSTALRAEVKARLGVIALGRLDGDGCVLITSQVTRSQERNLQDAREKLAAMIRKALTPPRPRKPTRPTLGSKRRRLEDKSKRADVKRTRGKVRDGE